MIASLRGILAEARGESIIIEVGGIGYEVLVHNRTQGSLPMPGSAITFYTYMQVLDNDIKLFGFPNRDELDLFKLLIGIAGMGARGAMNILAALAPGDFYRAVASGDEKRLLAVVGIGKKTAQRLVFELKDKVGQQSGLTAVSGEDVNRVEDVLEACEALGYQRSEIFPLLLEMQNQGELSSRVEESVKQILRRKAAMLKK